MNRQPSRTSTRHTQPATGPRVRRRRLTRAVAVQRMRARLLRDGFPRVQMCILVSLTGLAGFGASAGMLAAGIDTMALRYLLAMGLAYIVFLSLLWLWLRTSAADYVDRWSLDGFESDGVGAGGSGGSASGGVHAEPVAGAGGSFDGGGASANVEFGAEEGGGLEAIVEKPLDAIGQADEGAIPLVVILLALGIALSSLFVVWSAPVLFAEILVDALLAAGLYRRLRVLDVRHWMRSAVRRTIIPFVLTTLVVTGAGWAMQHHAPQARSLGEVIAGR
ncbi:hypothetical protein [Massilia phyllosphaerae]|uniref:hypothetical protein n=1 Tax=Massilia phyllosphaerae TaxID=3106034 RepID=UPI002B1CD233|nr:hypothetical protein [Massilia sp. SGZ-792]